MGGVYIGVKAVEARRAGLRASRGFSRDQELHSVGGRTGEGQETRSECQAGGTRGVGARVGAASRQVLGADRSFGDRGGHSDI